MENNTGLLPLYVKQGLVLSLQTAQNASDISIYLRAREKVNCRFSSV